jgi:glycosyltransferase involved in cell wall biosynthesis
MVRNMEPLTVPCGGNTWSESLRNIGRARVARAACRRASRVIAVSRYVERFVVDTWGLPPERVGLVYHGLDTAATASGTPPRALAEVDRFVFTAGSIRPARGLEDLIAAVPALLRAEPSLRIAIGGRADGTGRPYERRLRELASRLRVTSAIVWTGHLTAAEMAWAYRRCVAFVVTSRAEACPNVALEAMSHGAAIVSTAQEPMPEFFGESAVYYSPHDAAELALRLVETFSLSPAVSVRRELGLARAATFTWQGAADATIRELQRAVGTLR